MNWYSLPVFISALLLQAAFIIFGPSRYPLVSMMPCTVLHFSCTTLTSLLTGEGYSWHKFQGNHPNRLSASLPCLCGWESGQTMRNGMILAIEQWWNCRLDIC